MMASLGFLYKRGPITLAAAIASSVLAIVFAQAQWLPVAFVLIAMFAFSQSWFRTTSGALIQTLVPDTLRSRVTSFQSYGRGFVVPAGMFGGLAHKPDLRAIRNHRHGPRQPAWRARFPRHRGKPAPPRVTTRGEYIGPPTIRERV